MQLNTPLRVEGAWIFDAQGNELARCTTPEIARAIVNLVNAIASL